MHMFSYTEICFIGISIEDVATLGEADANPWTQDHAHAIGRWSERIYFLNEMIRGTSVARLKSRFYTFRSFESFAGQLPIILFERSRPAADATRDVVERWLPNG
jgi:hypothetical protein